jgi:hypothetical protein
MVVASSGVLVLIRPGAAVTDTDSATLPSSRAASTVSEAPTVTCLRVTAVLNPCSSKLISYDAADTFASTYAPAMSVVVIRVVPVESDVAVTRTPGTAVFCGSTTVPEILPVSICANAVDASAKRRRETQTAGPRRSPPPVVSAPC